MNVRRWLSARGRIAVAVATAALCAPALSVLPARAASTSPASCVATKAYRAGTNEAQQATPVICTGNDGTFSGEPTVGVSENGTVYLYPAYVQHPGTSYTRSELAVSDDRGSTFHLVQITAGGVVPMHEVDLDPYMYVDPRTSRIFVDSNTTGNCSQLSFSGDGGKTWTNTVDGCVTFDHENLFAGQAPPGGPQPAGYPDIVYRCSYSGGAFGTGHTTDACEKTLDGGLLWASTGAPAFVYDPTKAISNPDVSTTPYGCMDQLGHGVVGPDGTIYLPAGMCGVPEVAISHDEGASWSISVVSNKVLLHEFANGTTVNDTAVAVDTSGHLYALWISRNQLPYLARSEDGGRTWSAPVMVAPPGVAFTATPEITWGADGELAMSFMGSSNAPTYPTYLPCPTSASNCVTDETASSPSYANATWFGYLLVTTQPDSPYPVFVGGPVASGPYIRGTCGIDSCSAEKDFIDVRFGPDGTAYASYVDACSSRCATASGGSDDINMGVVARLKV